MADTPYSIENRQGQVRVRISPAANAEGTNVVELNVDLTKLSLPKSEIGKQSSQLLRHVPDAVPGVAKIVRAVEPENPSIRLFYIRNLHGSDQAYQNLHEVYATLVGRPTLKQEERDFLADLVRTQTKLVNNNLSETLKAVEYFHTQHRLDGFYLEGSTTLKLKPESVITAEEAQKAASPNRIAELAAIWKRLEESEPKTKEETAAYMKLRGETLIADNARFGLGRNIFSSLPRGASVLPTEFDGVSELIAKDSRNDLVTNCREDIALTIVRHLEKTGDKVAVMVFGGAHEFTDNVERHNKTHREQIALTVLEPVDYAQDKEVLYSGIEKIFEKLDLKLPDNYKKLVREKFGETP